jgi:Uma2 family endonuclease
VDPVFETRPRPVTTSKDVAFLEKLANRHRWTAADYADIPDDMRIEIYGGGLYVMPSPSFDHQVLVGDICIALRSAVADRRLVLPGIDISVLGDIFRPDIIVVREAAGDVPVPGQQVQVVVEIISANENIERTAKMAAYAAQGIPLYLIIGGSKGAHYAEVYTLAASGVYALQATVPAEARTEFGEPFPFTLDMKQINS